MTETTGSMPEPPATLGQRLRAEREKKGLSTQKAADALHLDGWVVDALEGGDYGRIGPAVYAKGHLKRYAALLGLPAAEILDAYDAQSATPAPGQSAGLRLGTASTTGSEAPWAQMLGFAVVAVIVAGVVWWKPWNIWLTNGTGTAPPSAAGAAAGAAAAGAAAAGAAAAAAGAAEVGAGTAAVGTDPAAVVGLGAGSAEAGADPTAVGLGAGTAEARADPAAAGWGAGATAAGVAPRAGRRDEASNDGPAFAGRALAAPALAAPAVAVPALAAAASAPPRSATVSRAAVAGAAAGAGHARLRLSFSADAWVDVHDATGQRLYAGNGRANSVKTLSGEAPLRVYLRSAGGVQLQINDRAVAIGQQFVSGDAARFEVGADGVLRRESRPPAVASPTAKVASPHG